MECDSKYFRISEAFLLSFSVILQFICLAAPGWIIELRKHTVDKYRGLFYMTECKYLSEEERECKTKSWHDRYTEDLTKDPFDEYFYHSQIRAQIILLVSFALTTTCLVLQYYKHKNKNLGATVLLTSVEMVFLALAGAFIISYVSFIYININYLVNDYKLDQQRGYDVSVGFPYCALLDTVVFLIILVTVILDINEIRKVLREYSGPMQSNTAEGIVMSQLDNSSSTATLTSHVKSEMA